MRNAIWFGLCALAVLALPPLPAKAALVDDKPPSPPFDGGIIEGGRAEDAAVKAVGSIAAQFIDRSVYGPFFFGPQDIWQVKFLTAPRLIEPGLCFERMLVVRLRVGKTENGQASYRALGADWVDGLRAVGNFQPQEISSPDPAETQACKNLEPFKAQYSHDLLAAPSPEVAWQGGLTLQAIVGAAQNRADLPFSLECKSSPFDGKLCRTPRQVLANLKLLELWNVRQCDSGNRSKNCIRLDIGTPGHFGEDYWELTVELLGSASTKATGVSMQFVVPPQI